MPKPLINPKTVNKADPIPLDSTNLDPTNLDPTNLDWAALAWANLQPQDQVWLSMLVELAQAQAGLGVRVALVGGAVRDALLGGTPLDLDVVIEGVDIAALAEATGLPFSFHPAYQNATVSLPDGRFVDLVRARQESYPVAGQNPQPQLGTLEQDLQRRDFSLNALAIVLSPLQKPVLLNVRGGLKALSQKILSPLSPHSFSDDASRLVRAARLAARLGLNPSEALLNQVPMAVAMAPKTPRLWAELKLMLSEPRPAQVARLLADWGAGSLLPNLNLPDLNLPDLNLPDLNLLDQLDALTDTHQPMPMLYAAALYAAALNDWGAIKADELATRLNLGEKPIGLLKRALSDVFYPADTPEITLRQLLRPQAYMPLTGKDVLALGVPAGKQIGAALAYLANLRAAGQVHSPDDERLALAQYLKTKPAHI